MGKQIIRKNYISEKDNMVLPLTLKDMPHERQVEKE